MLRKEKKTITDTKERKVLNVHHINIVERSCVEKPTSVAKQSYLTDHIKIIDHVTRHYEDHPSGRHIKKNVKPPQNCTCSFLTIFKQEVKRILKELSTERSVGVNAIPPKLVKLAANYLAGLNNSIKKGFFLKMQRLPQLLP